MVLALPGLEDAGDILGRDPGRGDHAWRDERHGIDPVDQVGEQRVPRSIDDQRVEAQVHRRIGFLLVTHDPLLRHHPVALVEHVAQRGDQFGPGAPRRDRARRLALEQAAQLGRAETVLDAEPADRIAAPSDRLEQAFGGKRGDNVADRGARHAQPLGDRRLGDAGAAGKFARNDQLADPLRDTGFGHQRDFLENKREMMLTNILGSRVLVWCLASVH